MEATFPCFYSKWKLSNKLAAHETFKQTAFKNCTQFDLNKKYFLLNQNTKFNQIKKKKKMGVYFTNSPNSTLDPVLLDTEITLCLK